MDSAKAKEKFLAGDTFIFDKQIFRYDGEKYLLIQNNGKLIPFCLVEKYSDLQVVFFKYFFTKKMEYRMYFHKMEFVEEKEVKNG